uniref:hypothetical protein n=1 Tax=Candidatus Limisoma sp. TaxID=3076476 RepID=UPI0040293454
TGRRAAKAADSALFAYAPTEKLPHRGKAAYKPGNGAACVTAAHTCLARNHTGRIQTIGAHACQRSRCASTAKRAGTRHAPAACVPEVRHYG